MCDILHGSEKIKTEEDASSCSFSESSQNEEEKRSAKERVIRGIVVQFLLIKSIFHSEDLVSRMLSSSAS